MTVKNMDDSEREYTFWFFLSLSTLTGTPTILSFMFFIHLRGYAWYGLIASGLYLGIAFIVYQNKDKENKKRS